MIQKKKKLPGTNLVYTGYIRGHINSVHFNSEKCPIVGDKLDGHLIAF